VIVLPIDTNCEVPFKDKLPQGKDLSIVVISPDWDKLQLGIGWGARGINFQSLFSVWNKTLLSSGPEPVVIALTSKPDGPPLLTTLNSNKLNPGSTVKGKTFHVLFPWPHPPPAANVLLLLFSSFEFKNTVQVLSIIIFKLPFIWIPDLFE